MDVAGSAVGIASLGIQVCQGLLRYYDDWKNYEDDINETHKSIGSLSETLTLLKDTLEGDEVDQERARNVSDCLKSCSEALQKLERKAHKLRKYDKPQGAQEGWSQMQRMWYPFRASTLAKLRETVDEIQNCLGTAMQTLQLHMSRQSHRMLVNLDERTSNIEQRQLSDEVRKIADWLAASDPWSNHSSAWAKREPSSGTWLLDSDTYRQWKAGSIRHMWLYGKAGCGKTVLSSAIIEDMKTFCAAQDVALAVFYFTFSDTHKQTYDDLLRSLVSQLGLKEPGLSILRPMYTRGTSLSRSELESVLHASTQAKKTCLVLDALDESPEEGDVRQDLLAQLQTLAARVNIFATSRVLREIGEIMSAIDARPISTTSSAVDTDIQLYVSSQLRNDRKLCRFTDNTKSLVERNILEKSDGMFRWAYCQLQELKKLKSSRPSIVEKALRDLPSTLDETYSRMLMAIDPVYRRDALALLQWIAYSRMPLNLTQLVEAVIIDADDDTVHKDDRGGIEDVLDLLAGLITVTGHSITPLEQVRLAHFSVKEYLESERIQSSPMKAFRLQSAYSHRLLARSCLTYLMHWSNDDDKEMSQHDLATYPLLEYSVDSWCYHSRLQPEGDISRELKFVRTHAVKDWLIVFGWNPWRFASSIMRGRPSWYRQYPVLSQMIVLDLVAVARELLGETDINSITYEHGNLLHALICTRKEAVLQLLLDAGADVNAENERYHSALCLAVHLNKAKMVNMLLKAGADVNMTHDRHGTALQHARSTSIVRMLLDAGANVNTNSGRYGNALQAASCSRGHYPKSDKFLGDPSVGTPEEVVQILLKAGADVDAQGGCYGSALQAAVSTGNHMIVRMLLDAGANVNARGGRHGSAMQAACAKTPEIARMLLEAGADPNISGGRYANPLAAARAHGSKKMIQMLIRAGAVAEDDAS